MKRKPVFFPFQAEKKNQTPVTRSSCVFYFQVSESTNTSLNFLNYWKIKRGINDVKITATCRNMIGELLLEENISLPEQGAIIVDVRELLRLHNIVDNCQGSIELQIFSDKNMFVPYPAVSVYYEGPNWHTSGHSAQRYYSPLSADQNIQDVKFAEEGNQSILNKPNIEPFFIIHNGGYELQDDDAYIEVASQTGRKTIEKMPSLDWQPYETKIFYLKDLLNYRQFLDKEDGTFRIGYHCCGVFPRIIAGLEDTDSGAWSVDHTNFASVGESAPQDLFDVVKEPNFKNLTLRIPSISEKKLRAHVDIYPTYPDLPVSVEVSKSTEQGFIKDDVSLPPQKETKFTRIDMSNTHGTELSFTSDKKLPRRFHLGIYYQIEEFLPSILVTGPLPYEYAPTHTRWAPIFAGHNKQNFLLVSTGAFGDETANETTFNCQVFNKFEQDPLCFAITLPAQGYRIISLESEIDGLEEYLQNQPGWIYMNSDIPSRSLFYYFSVFNNQSIACDHSF